ncbi:MAG: DUF72 domain-containing protein [Candidatus Micrarchaeia archaeon]
MKTAVGCCGWGFFRPADYFGKEWKKKFPSSLAAYARLFSLVEVNSTFYRIPKAETAAKWLEQARAANPAFAFTVKAFQGITHEGGGFGPESLFHWERTHAVASALRAKIVLFQSPASFRPTAANKRRMKKFFGRADRGKLLFAWEPRGAWWGEEGAVRKICAELDLIACVDPLRNLPPWLAEQPLLYFRLHGFGKPSMYNYRFSDAELAKVKQAVTSLSRSAYILFNNFAMYEDALRFQKMF